MGKQVAAGTFEGGIAQLGEHLLCKQGVKGSNPFISTQIVESSHGRAGQSPEDRRRHRQSGECGQSVSPRDRRTVPKGSEKRVRKTSVRKTEALIVRTVHGSPLCTLKIAYKHQVKTFKKKAMTSSKD